MGQSFDPYYKWLGIPPEEQPPNHYRLLGLRDFEADPDVVEAAADQRMAHLRTYQTGPNVDWSQRLLNAVAASKICLLNAAKRAGYDQQLREAMWQEQSAVAPEPAEELNPALAFIVNERRPRPSSHLRRKRHVSTGPILVGIMVVGAIIIVGLAYHSPGSQQASTPTARQNRPSAGRGSVDALSRRTPDTTSTKSDCVFYAEARPKRSRPATRYNRKPAKSIIDAKKTAAFARSVLDAKTYLANRDLVSADKHVAAALANAQTAEDRDQVDRLETMLDHLTQFWGGIRVCMAKLRSAEEIVLEDTRFIVVESGHDRLAVKTEGRVLHYKAVTLPTSLVMAIVDRYFGKDQGSRAIIGTFLAIDPSGDHALARQYWQEAAVAGIDSDRLLRELDGLPSAGTDRPHEGDPTIHGSRVAAIEPPIQRNVDAHLAGSVGDRDLHLPSGNVIEFDSFDIRRTVDRDIDMLLLKCGANKWDALGFFQAGSKTAIDVLASIDGKEPHGPVVFFHSHLENADQKPRQYVTYRSGRWHGLLATWDVQGQKEFWCNYCDGQRDGLCYLFDKDALKLVLECTHGKVDAVHLIMANQIARSIMDADQAAADQAIGPMLKRTNEIEQGLKVENQAFCARVKTGVQFLIGERNQLKRAAASERRKSRDAAKAKMFRDLQKRATGR